MTGCTCMIDEGTWDEGPSMLHVSHPKARKDHICCECRNKINPRESYEKITGIWDGDFYTFKTCNTCAEIRDCYCCSWQYECVWESVKEYFREQINCGDLELCVLDALSQESRTIMIELIQRYMDEEDG